MNPVWEQYLDIFKQVVKPALGCTEPIAAAFTASVAAKYLDGKPEKISVFVSDNLFKNAMGVYVPGTGKIGLSIAVAAGFVAGDSEAELEVLSDITKEQVDQSQALIDTGSITIHRYTTPEFIYCKVIAKSEHDFVSVTISGGHTNITEIIHNDKVILKATNMTAKTTARVCDNVDINIQKIYRFATEAPIEKLSFILDSATVNEKLSKEGLKKSYGLEVGRSIIASIEKGLLHHDLQNDIILRTAAASDARMGGATLPAMSNYGSGNQGIAATMPLVVAKEKFNCSKETLARSLIMSHLGAVYIKSHYAPLSAFCGNTATSAATAMALVYIAGGNYHQSCAAIANVLSDSSGMICDGAKASCAMKVSTSSSTAVRSYLMAMNNHYVTHQGIIADDIEQTIKNLGELITYGMSNTDTVIINIMSA